jgi:hypothetical protein
MSVESGVLVVHCSDPRFQDAFHGFLRNTLRLERYALVAVPGGPQFLALADYLPKFSWAGWRWVKFLGKLGNSGRVILIAHDDCRWYLDMGFAPLGADRLRAKQVEDIRSVAGGLRERFETCRIEAYHARFEGSRVVFDPL